MITYWINLLKLKSPVKSLNRLIVFITIYLGVNNSDHGLSYGPKFDSQFKNGGRGFMESYMVTNKLEY